MFNSRVRGFLTKVRSVVGIRCHKVPGHRIDLSLNLLYGGGKPVNNLTECIESFHSRNTNIKIIFPTFGPSRFNSVYFTSDSPKVCVSWYRNPVL